MKGRKSQAKPASGRPGLGERAGLIAFLCAVGVFLFVAAFLFVDAEKVEKRDAAIASSGAVVPVPAAPAKMSPRDDTLLSQSPRGDTPMTQPHADARTQPEARKPEPPKAPRTKEVPTPAADPSQALNETLKAASLGDWARVDRLIEQKGASASAGSSKAAEGALVEQGKQAIAGGDYAKAIQALNAVLAERPEDADALNRLAFALLREGEVEEAQLQVTRSLKLSPAHAATWANAAEIMAERDNPIASQAALRVAIHLTRDPERARRFLAQADRTVASAKFRAVIAEVLPEFGNIPKTRSSAP